jgi:deoxyribodipyrimidine photolyase-related protein
VITNIHIWEHPLFFSSAKRIKKFHIFKLVLHKASIRAFTDYFHKSISISISNEFNQNEQPYLAFDPVDNDIKFNSNATILDSPGFLLSLSDIEHYKSYCNKKNIQIFSHSNFYKWQLQNLTPPPPGISKSLDKYNRKPFQKHNPPIIPQLPKIPTKDKNYVSKAFIEIRNSNIPFYDTPNYYNFNYPVTRQTALLWLDDFIQNRLTLFGPYQDAISHKHPHLFHSVLSSSINIGLLTPKEIFDKISKIYKSIPSNSYEGFIRQIVGWREYERFLYVEIGKELIHSNHFNHTKKLPIKGWYTSYTENTHHKNGPLKDAIISAYRTAYMHHIQRLMVVLNYMLLSGFSPKSIYDWFMTFSIDAYDWVMVGNVYSMGFASTKGMKRPYISSSNYLIKMSDSMKDGIWDKEWDRLYRDFVNKYGRYGNKKQLK